MLKYIEKGDVLWFVLQFIYLKYRLFLNKNMYTRA